MSDAQPWIAALRTSHDRLAGVARPTDAEWLRRTSYASEWTNAQVLSHLGSGAEIFALRLEAGHAGEEVPGQDVMRSIWAVWDARTPEEQAAESLAADARLVERIEGLSPEDRDRFAVSMFGMDLDLAGLLRMRLSEHAMHTWDVAVVTDPEARLSPDAVELLVDDLGLLAQRAGKPTGDVLKVRVATAEPPRSFVLDIGLENVTVQTDTTGAGDRTLRMPAEAFLRLLAGRLDRDHCPPVVTYGVGLDDVRRAFPGF